MNKEKKIITIITLILTSLIIIFAVLNKNSITNIGTDKVDKAILFIVNNNKYYVDFEHIEKLPSEEFEAVIRSSSKKPKNVTYTAVKLLDILNSLNEDYSDAKKAVIRAEDAYTSAVSIDDINIDDNVYVAYKLDGRYLKSKQDGGEGPFQLIIRKDNFSQRWVKYIVEVELQ